MAAALGWTPDGPASVEVADLDGAGLKLAVLKLAGLNPECADLDPTGLDR